MVTPLRNRTLEGKSYRRLPGIEAAILVASAQDLETILSRATIRHPKVVGYLPSECLVYLVREALRRKDEARYRVLLQMLLNRCEFTLQRHVSEDAFPDATSLRNDILSEFADLFVENWANPDATKLDFYEIRFNSGFAAFYVDRVRAETSRTEPLRSYAGEADDGPETAAHTSSDEEALANLVESDLLENASPSEIAFRDEVFDAINKLPPDERDAITLHYRLGYEIESQHPSKRTVASLCKVAGRTIRNRLARGLKTLKQLKK